MLQRAGFTTSVTRKSVLLCLCICGAVLLEARTLPSRAAARTPASTTAGTTPTLANFVTTAHKGLCGQILLPLDTRGKLATFLQLEKAKVGVELGVQNGNFAKTILHQWLHNVKYYLVDIWAPLENYLDAANVGQLLTADHPAALLRWCPRIQHMLRGIELTFAFWWQMSWHKIAYTSRPSEP